MIVNFGQSCPNGCLPVYSVADEEEAQDLITLACPTNFYGEHIAPELVEEQTLENLEKFSDRLDRAHAHLKLRGFCRCREKTH